MRELRLSLERAKPAQLPCLKDVLSGAVDAEEQQEAPAKLPKMQRPPPVLDDNLWHAITTEVKRKSMQPALSLNEADEADEAEKDPAREPPSEDENDETEDAESVDALANKIKTQIGTYTTVLMSCVCVRYTEIDVHAFM